MATYHYDSVPQSGLDVARLESRRHSSDRTVLRGHTGHTGDADPAAYRVEMSEQVAAVPKLDVLAVPRQIDGLLTTVRDTRTRIIARFYKLPSPCPAGARRPLAGDSHPAMTVPHLVTGRSWEHRPPDPAGTYRFTVLVAMSGRTTRTRS